MAITQLSAFLANTSGTLYDAVTAITDAGVNIRALSVADTYDFGILRVIVSDVEKAKAALSPNLLIKETPVIAVQMSDKEGALKDILAILKDANVNVEYVYAFTGTTQGEAYAVLRVDDVDKTEALLAAHSRKTLSDADMKTLL